MNANTFLKKAATTAILAVSLARPATAADTRGLTPELRDQFLTTAEQSLRSRAKVTPDFWSWLAKHPQIRAGLFSTEAPVPPVFAENLDNLRRALGPEKSDRYASLLLGASLGKPAPFGNTNADRNEVPADPRVTKVAAYLREKKLSLVEFLPKEGDVFKELALTPLKNNERGNFLAQLANASGTFPPREPLSLAEELKKVIARYETKLSPFADKGPEWPLFPLDTAPWPLLAPMRQTISEREMDYLWERFQGKLAGSGDKRLVTYSRYGWDYDKPEVRYKQSDWEPNTIPRIIEDGGVCGRQGHLAQMSQIGLGRPAVDMYQPGHNALLSYRYDAKTRGYSAVCEQSITGPDKSTCQWYLPTPAGPRGHLPNAWDKTPVGVEYHVALALAMNLGLDRYTDSRIACLLAQKNSGREQRELLDSAVNLNPFNLDAWFALVKNVTNDTAAVNQLVARLDALMAAPDSGLAEEAELAADTDLSRQTAPTADSRREANLVATQVGDSIIETTYSPLLTDKTNLTRNRANLRAEVLRRIQLKIPHGQTVQGLVFRYDIAAEGPYRTQTAVAAEIKNLFAEKTAKRKRLAEAAQQHVEFVLAALPKAAERVTWLASLRTSIPVDERHKLDKDGKAAAEPLYNYLNTELLKSLKATGQRGAEESKRLTAEIEAARLYFETRAKKT